MPCELLDFRCILVNELVGSTLLAVVLAAIMYLIVAGKLKFGFDTTIALAIPILFLVGLAVSGFSAIYAFGTLLAALLIAWLFNKIIGN